MAITPNEAKLVAMLRAFLDFRPIVNGSKMCRENFAIWKESAAKLIEQVEAEGR